MCDGFGLLRASEVVESIDDVLAPLPCEPILDESARYAQSSRHSRHVVGIIPSAFPQFALLQPQFAGGIFRRKSQHDACGKWPRLRTEVAQVLNLEACFFLYFPAYALLQRFARLHESRYESHVVGAEGFALYHEKLVATAYSYDYGWRKLRPPFALALWATLGYLRVVCKWRSAGSAISRMLVPMPQFRSLAACFEVCSWEVVVGLAKSEGFIPLFVEVRGSRGAALLAFGILEAKGVFLDAYALGLLRAAG